MTLIDIIADQFLYRTIQSATPLEPEHPAIGEQIVEFSMENELGLGSFFRLVTDGGNEVILQPEDNISLID